MSTNDTVGNFSSDGVPLNATRLYPDWNNRILPIFAVIKAIIGVTGLVGNIIVLLVMYRYRKLFVNVKTAYVINQSVLDAVTSFVLILASFLTVELLPLMEGLTAELYCRLWMSQILLWGLMSSSTYNLMFISIERYIAVAHPLLFRTSFSNIKIRTSIVAIWVCGITYMTSLVIPTSRISHGWCLRAYFWPSKMTAAAVGSLTAFLNIVMPIVVHCLCYVRILVILRKRVSPAENFGPSAMALSGVPSVSTGVTAPATSSTRSTVQMRHLRRVGRLPTNQSSDTSRLSMKATKNVTKSFAIVTACFFVCWIPRKTYVYLYRLGTVTNFRDTFQYTVILAFLNCCINPFIYAAKYDAFKKGLAKLFRCG